MFADHKGRKDLLLTARIGILCKLCLRSNITWTSLLLITIVCDKSCCLQASRRARGSGDTHTRPDVGTPPDAGLGQMRANDAKDGEHDRSRGEHKSRHKHRSHRHRSHRDREQTETDQRPFTDDRQVTLPYSCCKLARFMLATPLAQVCCLQCTCCTSHINPVCVLACFEPAACCMLQVSTVSSRQPVLQTACIASAASCVFWEHGQARTDPVPRCLQQLRPPPAPSTPTHTARTPIS